MIQMTPACTIWHIK